MEGDQHNDGKGGKVEFGRGKYEQNTIYMDHKIITQYTDYKIIKQAGNMDQRVQRHLSPSLTAGD